MMMRFTPHQWGDDSDLDDIGEILAKGDEVTTFVWRHPSAGMESAAGLLFAALAQSRWAGVGRGC